MDTEQKLRLELQRADHAQQLRDNPLLTEALETFEMELTEAWTNSPQRDAEGRERLFLMLSAAKKFRNFLSTTIQTGQMARSQIKEVTAKPGPLSQMFRRVA